MAAAFQLNVITQAKTLMSGEVQSITAPGAEGYLGIWANHAPLVTVLIPGKLTIKDMQGQESIYAVTGGFLEVSRNVATLLADAMEPPAEIDVDRAKASAERARKRLEGGDSDLDVFRAESSLARAELRLRIAREVVRKAS